MIMKAGYTLTKTDKRDAAVEAFAGMVERARKHDGCLDLSISADAVDPDRVNFFECWRDQQSWKARRKIAKPPRVKLVDSFLKAASQQPRSHTEGSVGLLRWYLT